MRRLDLAEPPCGVLVPLDLEKRGDRGGATGELGARVPSSTAVEIRRTLPRASPPRASGRKIGRERKKKGNLTCVRYCDVRPR
ncbi:hypothetical protein E2562_021756 [Oryza meyeriana var. granulata]|uniref:Uncharacterized protein n=1 Tax=Oryza meyeriana var. granulata TaxID=110450 RepID=A0A6G1EY26_9ORYZ|nr:hypothetical protein E2562_021756 [Oryza meyeriana var. granulata]